jgi:hypothetical protein
MQDLHRWGLLHSRRYAYVLEFQRETQQPHFHLLCDSSFVGHAQLIEAWGKHRPKSAGPSLAGRPPLGWCWISKPKFANARHAARYATKYLVKVPKDGFPSWVLVMGRDRRVPRFQPSRGFWGGRPEPRTPAESTRQVVGRSYADRLADCGSTVNMFQAMEHIDTDTGEVRPSLRWCGRIDESAGLLSLIEPGLKAGPCKATIRASSPKAAAMAIGEAAGRTIRFLYGPVGGGEVAL